MVEKFQYFLATEQAIKSWEIIQIWYRHTKEHPMDLTREGLEKISAERGYQYRQCLLEGVLTPILVWPEAIPD